MLDERIKTQEALLKENEELRLRLTEAEETLNAIRNGEVDALVASGPEGEQVFTLKGADHAYRILIETMNEGAAVISHDGMLVYCNERLARMLDVPIEKIMGNSLYDFITAQDIPSFKTILQEFSVNRRVEVNLRKKNGNILPVLIACNPLEFETKGFCIVLTDLTEIKEAKTKLISQEALRQSEENLHKLNRRLRTLMEALPVGVSFSTDASCQYISGNSAVLAQFEMKPKDNLSASASGKNEVGRKIRFLKEGREISDSELPLQRAVKENRSIAPMELEVILPSGKRWFTMASGAPIRDEHGKVLGGVAVTVDITDRKRAEEALSWLGAIVESSDDAIISKNLNGTITSWNKGAEMIFGYKAEEVIGKSVLLLIPKGRHNEEPEIVKKLQRREKIDHYETVRQRKDGTLIDVSLTVSPIMDSKGNVIAASKIARNITEQRKIQESLAKMNQELEKRVAERTHLLEEQSEKLRKLAVELIDAEETERKRLAQVLHDHLQQLLVAAKMKIDLIQRKETTIADKNALPELRKFIDEAFDSSRSLTAELRPPVLYEGGLIPALRFLARKFYDQYQFKINLSAEDGAEPVSDFMKTMIYSTIREIVFNAVKYSKVGECSLEIKRLPDNNIQIIVHDQGVGFDTEVISKKGSEGFGLFSIRERIKALGGELKIESSLAHGARFEINVPDNKEEIAVGSEEIEGIGSHIKGTNKRKNGGLSVLLVDDHKILRQSLANLLIAQPFINEIIEAEDGQDAVDKARYANPDVIIMDLNMPRINGIEATKIIHEKYPHIKIIGLSIQTEQETMQAMKDHGAVAYFHKGEETDVLIEALKDFSKPELRVN